MGKNVDKHHLDSDLINAHWTTLVNRYSLSDTQKKQFRLYLDFLITWNEKFNLTAITDPIGIIEYHFNHSLALSKEIDFSAVQTTADIGTGAGFPGLPLKILYPHLHMILIEVNNKKRSFLEHIAQQFGLKNITIYPHDWRTFLRSTQFPIDYFFARASLQPEELIRIFKPSCTYKNGTMIYWASCQWKSGKVESNFVEKEIVYKLDNVQRKFVFFKQKK